MVTPATLRAGGLLALGFVILTLLAALVPHETLPENPPPADEVRSFFERNAAMQAMQPFSKMVAAFMMIGFAAVLAAVLRDAGARIEGDLVLAGGALFATALVAVMLIVASVVTLAPILDGDVVFAVYNIAWIANVRAGLAAVPMLAAVGIGVLRTRALPRWTGYAAIAAAVVGLAGGAASIAVPGPVGIGPAFLGFLAVVAWTLATGIACLAVSGRATTAPPTVKKQVDTP